jgi:hypothetical protein
VNLDNAEGLLRPGMNGQVAVLIDERDGVLAIPNDAIKNPREAVATGAMLGLAADTINKELAAQGYTGGNRGGFNRGGGAGGAGGGRRNGGGAAAPNGGTSGSANGDVALMDSGVARNSASTVAMQGGGGFGQGGGFGGGQQVSDADCKKIDDILKKHPKEKKQIDDLRAKLRAMMPAGFGGGNRNGGGNGGNGGFNRQGGNAGGNGGGERPQRQPGDTTRRGGNGGGQQGGGNGGQRGGNPEMRAINDQLRAIYEPLGIDSRQAGQCARRAQGGQQANGGAGNGRQANGPTGPQARGLAPNTEFTPRPVRQRQGLVFVSDSSKTVFHPRIVMLGQANLDYTEVISGLKEGERVVMLGALALQAQRQQQQDRARQNASPLGGQQGPGGPGGGGPPGGGGGGARGGRGG